MAIMKSGQPTPNQTAGPFFHLGITRAGEEILVDAGQPGRIRIEGRVLDGAGDPVPDALLEIWQANGHGRYNHPADDRDDLPLDAAFSGHGRCPTDAEGRYHFETVKPGPVPGLIETQAPHVVLQVFARGMLIHNTTRCYFDDDAANADDAVLQQHVPSDRRPTLIATRQPDVGGAPSYRFDIVLQGDDETVFFDV